MIYEHIDPIVEQAQYFLALIKQVITMQERHHQQVEIGKLAKVLVDSKFKGFDRELRDCRLKLLMRVDKNDFVLFDDLNYWLNEMMALFTGLGPLKLEALDLITDLVQYGVSLCIQIKQSIKNKSKVRITHAHLCEIRATGSVLIQGIGAYHSDISAGQDTMVS